MGTILSLLITIRPLLESLWTTLASMSLFDPPLTFVNNDEDNYQEKSTSKHRQMKYVLKPRNGNKNGNNTSVPNSRQSNVFGNTKINQNGWNQRNDESPISSIEHKSNASGFIDEMPSLFVKMNNNNVQEKENEDPNFTVRNTQYTTEEELRKEINEYKRKTKTLEQEKARQEAKQQSELQELRAKLQKLEANNINHAKRIKYAEKEKQEMTESLNKLHKEKNEVLKELQKNEEQIKQENDRIAAERATLLQQIQEQQRVHEQNVTRANQEQQHQHQALEQEMEAIRRERNAMQNNNLSKNDFMDIIQNMAHTINNGFQQQNKSLIELQRMNIENNQRRANNISNNSTQNQSQLQQRALYEEKKRITDMYHHLKAFTQTFSDEEVNQRQAAMD